MSLQEHFNEQGDVLMKELDEILLNEEEKKKFTKESVV